MRSDPGCLRAQALEAERVERIRLIEIARLDDLQVLKPIFASALSFLDLYPSFGLRRRGGAARAAIVAMEGKRGTPDI